MRRIWLRVGIAMVLFGLVSSAAKAQEGLVLSITTTGGGQTRASEAVVTAR